MNELGPVLSVHKGRLDANGHLWPVGLALIFCGVGAIGWSVTTPQAISMVTAVLALLASLVAAGGCFLASYGLMVQELVAHRDGFVWKRLFRAPLVVRWEEIRKVQVLTRTSKRLRYPEVIVEVQLRGHKFIEVNNDLTNFDAIRDLLTVPRSGPSSAASAATAPSPWG